MLRVRPGLAEPRRSRVCAPGWLSQGRKELRVLPPPGLGGTATDLVLCQRRRRVHSSKMLRRMSEAGEAPVTVGFKVWRVLAGPLDLGSVSPWNGELCRDTELGLCWPRPAPFRL